MSDLVGQTISEGRFLIEREIGRGGAGIVFEAVDVLLKRQVAIKTITSQSNSSNKRFEREVKSLASVKCQYVPEIYNWGNTVEGLPFIVMELLPYSTLEETLLGSENVLTNDDICAIAIEITKALSIIHDAGIVHRDLKPSNVMIHFDEVTGWSVKLLDFGLVHLLAPDQGLTGTANTVGSIGYFSPEHATPRQIDCRSDIFSLGCILFRAAAGRPPFEAENLFASVLLMNSDTPVAIPTAIPAHLRQIIAKCLQADPAKRFQNALEVRQALESKTFIASPEEVSKKKPRSAKLALLIASVLAVTVLCFVLQDLRNRGDGANFAIDKKTLSQSLTEAAASRDPLAQGKLLKKLAATEGFWSLSTEHNRADLKEIASSQFTNGVISSGELAFDCIFRSLTARRASNEEWIEAYNNETARYCDASAPCARAFANGKKALKMSVEAKSLPLQRRSYFLLAQLHRLTNDVDTSLSYLKKAHSINTDQNSPDESFDAKIAMKYAELLIQKGDPERALPLLSYAVDRLSQYLVRTRVLDYAQIEDLYNTVAALKKSPNTTRLTRQVTLLLDHAAPTFSTRPYQLQTRFFAAALKLKQDAAGAVTELREIMKSAERSQEWMIFISAACLLSEQKAITVPDFSDLIRRGLRNCHAAGKAPPIYYFTANSRAANANAKIGRVTDALDFYSSTVEEAQRYAPTKDDEAGQFKKIEVLIDAAEYGLVHGDVELAQRAFEQLSAAKIPPTLKARFDLLRAKVK